MLQLTKTRMATLLFLICLFCFFLPDVEAQSKQDWDKIITEAIEDAERVVDKELGINEYKIKMENLIMSLDNKNTQEEKTQEKIIIDLINSWENKDNFLAEIDLTEEERAFYYYYKHQLGKK